MSNEQEEAAIGEIKHRFIDTNGIKMHIAEQGQGPLVLLLHGYPEFWYSWRYQIPFLAAAGFHVVAPDLRGFGESDAPQGAEKYTSFHIVGDLIGLLDALKEEKAFIICHDWGAIIAWDFCLFQPNRVRAIAAMSVPFLPRKASGSFLSEFRASIGEDFYMCKFQEPGKAESQFKELGTSMVLKSFILPHKVAEKDYPLWFSENDMTYYVDTYEKSGFTGALNLYRAIERTWELKAAWTGTGVQTPALFIAGSQDLVLRFPGMKEYIAGQFKDFVPNLKDVVYLDGAHFVHEENYEEVNGQLLMFLQAQNVVHNSN